MKNKTQTLLALLTGAFLLAAPLSAGDKEDMRVISDDGQHEVKVWTDSHGKTHHITLHDESHGPKTFLGVETSRAGKVLSAQLGLPAGVGLVVARVVPDTGAAKVLKKHDILIKFEDQLLFNSDQLGGLVTSKEPGTEVQLTIFRAGKEQVVTATLGERKAKAFRIQHGMHAAPTTEAHASIASKVIHGDMSQEDIERFVARSVHDGRVHLKNVHSGTVVYTDEEGTVKLISKDDAERQLIVLDADNNVLFEGPVDNDEQRGALEESVKLRLEKVENIHAIGVGDEDAIIIDEEIHELAPHASTEVIVKHLPHEG
jgi:hypothetical protein